MNNPVIPRFLPAGERALVVEFGTRIDDAINRRVLALASLLRTQHVGKNGVQAIVPTYRSLSVMYDPQRLSFEALRQLLLACIATLDENLAPATRRWRVPVCYGGAHGADLVSLAAAHDLTPEAVIALHTAPRYRIYMIGFLPGFAYLGGLDPQLHTPRRAAPRTITPAGSISIGGQQTAVASVAGPSGWHMLGRTPWRGFDLRRSPAFLFTAGDEVVFTPIDDDEFARLDAVFADPGWVPQPESLPGSEQALTETGL